MSYSRENEVNDLNELLLVDLPNEIWEIIGEFAPADKPLHTMNKLYCTNKSLYTLFKQKLTAHAIEKALALAADASEVAVPVLLKMLKSNPKLLLEKGNVFTRSGVIVENVTIYEF